MNRPRRKRPGLPPIGVQIAVVLHQLGDWTVAGPTAGDQELVLDLALAVLSVRIGCAASDLQLDHDPMLRVRRYRPRHGRPVASWYEPNAHDPNYLVWRSKRPQDADSHHIKTYVRGNNGQFSDVALANRERARERDPDKWTALRGLKKPARRRKPDRPKGSVGRSKIPSRPFASKGKRPLRGRRMR